MARAARLKPCHRLHITAQHTRRSAQMTSLITAEEQRERADHAKLASYVQRMGGRADLVDGWKVTVRTVEEGGRESNTLGAFISPQVCPVRRRTVTDLPHLPSGVPGEAAYCHRSPSSPLRCAR